MQRIVSLVDSLWAKRIVRSLFSGGISVVLQTVVFETLAIWLKIVTPSVATLIGGEASVLLNFILNNRLSFGDVNSRHSVLNRLVRFHLVVSGALLIQFTCVYVAEHTTNDLLTLHLAYAGSIVVSFFWNYSWYKLWVWRHHVTDEQLARGREADTKRQ